MLLQPPAEVGATAYVQASCASLHAQAQATAAVLAQPVTNTAVKVTAKNGEWCEVDVSPASVPISARHGFIACNLLTAPPLTLKIVEVQKVEGIELNYGTGSGCVDAPMNTKNRSMAGYAKPESAIVRWAGKPIAGDACARAKVKSQQRFGEHFEDFFKVA